jgi:hypothetical protein
MRIAKTKISASGFLVRAFLLLIIISITLHPNFGMWAVMGVDVPVERLVTNVANYIKQHPQDAQGHYVLGRLHSLAYAHETNTLKINERNRQELPGFLPWESIIVKRSKQGALTEKARNHLLESVRNYRRATELAPDQPMAFLGLGWMLESGAAYAPQLGAPPGEARLGKDANAWKKGALKAYRKAYSLALGGDLKRQAFGPAADPAISLEAGEGTVRILSARKTTVEEQQELSRVKDSIAKLQKKPRAITPIIFSLDRHVPLDDLLANDRIVRFDLAGDGQPGWWPWVKPDTAILVWDPKHSGRVESGLQLFGSATWWVAWEHGYQPLAALDDDRDGWLSGKELDGLAGWRDRNGNGISEPGEVLPARSLGIESIAASATAKTNGVPSNPLGLRLNNGVMLPTYDWTPTETATPTLARAE